MKLKTRAIEKIMKKASSLKKNKTDKFLARLTKMKTDKNETKDITKDSVSVKRIRKYMNTLCS
jgi:hypothetical protein